MINRPNNWNDVQEVTERQKLPLGAYVCRVKKTAIQSNAYGDQLCILFDIIEGDHKGYYAAEYAANQNQDKKWKGVLRQWLPLDNGSQQDEWTKSALKGMVSNFEKSNPGYQWNWDENSLVGKLIGILYRNEEWEYEGKTGWTAKPFRAISIDSVRNGDFTLPKDRPLKKEETSYTVPTYNVPTQNYQANTYNTNSFVVEDDDIPF